MQRRKAEQGFLLFRRYIAHVAAVSFALLFFQGRTLLLHHLLEKARLFLFGGGKHGWTIVSLIYSLICFVFLFIPVLAVKELSDSELMESGNETEKENKIGFIESVMLLFKNKYFIMLLVWYLVMFIASGVKCGHGIY